MTRPIWQHPDAAEPTGSAERDVSLNDPAGIEAKPFDPDTQLAIEKAYQDGWHERGVHDAGLKAGDSPTDGPERDVKCLTCDGKGAHWLTEPLSGETERLVCRMCGGTGVDSSSTGTSPVDDGPSSRFLHTSKTWYTGSPPFCDGAPCDRCCWCDKCHRIVGVTPHEQVCACEPKHPGRYCRRCNGFENEPADTHEHGVIEVDGLRVGPSMVRHYLEVVRAARAVDEACDLHRSDYSAVEWDALTKLRSALGSVPASSAGRDE